MPDSRAPLRCRGEMIQQTLHAWTAQSGTVVRDPIASVTTAHRSGHGDAVALVSPPHRMHEQSKTGLQCCPGPNDSAGRHTSSSSARAVSTGRRRGPTAARTRRRRDPLDPLSTGPTPSSSSSSHKSPRSLPRSALAAAAHARKHARTHAPRRRKPDSRRWLWEMDHGKVHFSMGKCTFPWHSLRPTLSCGTLFPARVWSPWPRSCVVSASAGSLESWYMPAETLARFLPRRRRDGVGRDEGDEVAFLRCKN
ncbi:uncharacterized protein IWZ02DRAFT_86126 [Phyllosticta citriasiana]|uniref:uncharacterized protein n=1 Tax=Phyllosticta citriasiana TaxID=595635 RepID=UPI0030FDA1D0